MSAELHAVDQPDEGPRFPLLELSDLAALPPTKYCLEPWLVVGVNTLIGAPSTWKTLLALMWGLTLANEGKRVVYVGTEGINGLYARIQAACHGLGIEEPPPGQFQFVTVPVEIAEDADELVDCIRGGGEDDPALVIGDTLTNMTAGLDENSSEMRRAMNALHVVQQAFGCAVLVLVHTGWNSARERGFSGQRGMVDMALIVQRNGDEDEPGPVARLRGKKNRDGELSPRAYFALATPPSGVSRYLVAATEADWSNGTTAGAHAGMLADKYGEGSFTVQQAADVWGVARNTASGRLNELAAFQQVAKTGERDGHADLWRVVNRDLLGGE
jgi:hypothetical protein